MPRWMHRGDVELAVDYTGSGHKWRLISMEKTE
jgi:hypothetical protein